MRVNPILAVKLLALSAAIAALAACGGGGGGGGGGGVPPVPTNTIALTAANAQNVGGDALLAGVQASGKIPGFLPALAQSGSAPRTHVLSRFLERQIARLDEVLQSRSGILAGVVTVTPCLVSGNIAVDVPDGSTVVETFNACSDVAGESVSGAITISGITATASTFSASVSVSLTFSFTGLAPQTFSGNFAISETGIGSNLVTITISGSELFLTEGSNVERLGNFTFSTTIDISTSASTDSVTFTFASTEIGGAVTVTTLTPFQTSPGREFPHAGAIQIVGALGSTIKITVNGDETGATPQVTIQLDANGDGVFELTLNKNWSDLTG